MICFCETDKFNGIPILRRFVENLLGIKNENYVIHHSHVTGKILGFAHLYCNEKVRENYFKILVIAHNLFKFDFFFLLKGLTSGVWKTKDINMGGKNPSDIHFASIGNQIQFVNTIKYFQQSLAALANNLSEKEKNAIYRECEKFLKNDPKFSK